MLAGKAEQPPAEAGPLVFRRDKQLIQVAVGQMQCQHRGNPSAIVGDKKRPPLFDLARHTRAQIGQ